MTGTVTHVVDHSDRYWRVVVELRRHQIAIEAMIPKDATADEVAAFSDRVTQAMRRRLGSGGKGATTDGETEGKGEGEIRGADAPGEGEAKGDPATGGKEGGPDPTET